MLIVRHNVSLSTSCDASLLLNLYICKNLLSLYGNILLFLFSFSPLIPYVTDLFQDPFISKELTHVLLYIYSLTIVFHVYVLYENGFQALLFICIFIKTNAGLFSAYAWVKKGRTQTLGQTEPENVHIRPNHGLKEHRFGPILFEYFCHRLGLKIFAEILICSTNSAYFEEIRITM